MGFSRHWKLFMYEIIFCFFSIFLSVGLGQCPVKCSCKWKHGKQTAECGSQGLDSVPQNLKLGTQVLELADNNIQYLPSRVFQQQGLVNLQKIYLSDCNLSGVANDTFYQLTNLVELDVSSNLLTTVPSISFRDTPFLRRLDLSKNPIRTIRNNSFSELSRLRSLELSNCQIANIEVGAFVGLERLEKLTLDGNKLRAILQPAIQGLPVFTLQLHNNPWHCDCELRSLVAWISTNNVPYGEPPSCDGPSRLAGRLWSTLLLDEFACIPEMITTNTDVIVDEGGNGTLECNIQAIPWATVYWEIDKVALKNLSSSSFPSGKLHIQYKNLKDFQTSLLTVITVTQKDPHVFTCVAENRAGISRQNFTLSVVVPLEQSPGWTRGHILGTAVGIFLLITILLVAFCIFIFRQRAVMTSSNGKMPWNLFLRIISSKKQETVEPNGVKNENEEKEISADEKQPRRQETGSSGYGSDQQTPDLVSKTIEANSSAMSLSFQPFQHPPVDLLQNTVISEGWIMPKRPFNATPDYSRMNYTYPDYDKNSDYMDPDNVYYPHYLDRGYYGSQVPENDRVRTLRIEHENTVDGTPVRDNSTSRFQSPSYPTWKRSPLVVPDNTELPLPPAEIRFSPDEGYAEGIYEGTVV
ncbi:leucine-rich repeat and immunoglobulin-like domain-containing nogo receptor-interacting protein 3 [Limulus polyphemus]|uniref:Leucine-rich repeat and immunoglobulin-like domain-containing nogo receptor-interacting protein 3 n=1 Tax=Limulus polyphemus TaxID=6850 RepID=A0ABM1BPU3_LIMPO|nr:leucine-rich repeat and immunoglobulin-like domain-containing nogo receptor-interacting protein 3 [Limulus polyphemus]XP_022254659.1 leucine-rich repeat and immunoglobulin-like domain-containing nogo receptor-interacting protein 3 [Limulus polyphemus]